MPIGIFADSHDHLDHIRRAVDLFNAAGCELVLFAGDLVSPIAVPPLRKLNCPLLGCFGDNEGNRTGILSGMKVVGQMADGAFGIEMPDGCRILVAHQFEAIRGLLDGSDVVVTAHTHKPAIRRDERGRLFLNPGETAGWTYRNPTVILLTTSPRQAEIVPLTATAAIDAGEDGGPTSRATPAR